MAFKKARQYDEEQTKKVRKKLEEENSFGDNVPRAKIKQGLNVYMWLPSMDQREDYYNPEPIRFMGIHYGPFHACSRNDAVMDDKMTELVEDRSFRGCKRCMTAWNTYQDHGGSDLDDKHPAVRKRSSDLANMRGVIQVVELTSFFELDSTGTEIELNEKMLDYWEDFLATIETGELPEGTKMPKDMQESALAGASLLIVNKDVGKELAKLHYVKSIKLGKAENKSKKPKSPLMEPERFLLSIVRGEDSSSTFTGRNGKVQKKGTYELEINEVTEADWEEMCGQLLETFEEKEGFEWIDIYNPAVEIPEDASEEDQLRLVASALIKLEDEEIEALLELEKHSYDYRDDIKKQKDQHDEDDDEDEDDEEEVPKSSRRKAKPAKPAKSKKSKARDDDDDDDEDEDDDEEEAAGGFHKFRKPAKSKAKAKATKKVEEDDDDDYYESLDDDDEDDDDDDD